jgi:hypothetical protein
MTEGEKIEVERLIDYDKENTTMERGNKKRIAPTSVDSHEPHTPAGSVRSSRDDHSSLIASTDIMAILTVVYHSGVPSCPQEVFQHVLNVEVVAVRDIFTTILNTINLPSMGISKFSYDSGKRGTRSTLKARLRVSLEMVKDRIMVRECET